MRILIIVALLCASLPSAAPATSQHFIKASIKEIIKKHNLEHALLGIAVMDEKSGDMLYEYNSQKMFIPASNAKLFTTAAALEFLGQNFTFRTSLYSAGNITESTLEGDLVLQGGNDSTLCTDGLKNLAHNLAATGIKTITGDLIIDTSHAGQNALRPSWEIEDVGCWYCQEISPLCCNQNCISIAIEPTHNGMPPTVTINQIIDYCQLCNNAVCCSENEPVTLSIARGLDNNSIVVSGTLPLSTKPITKTVALHNPAIYTALLFRKFLQEEGITITGSTFQKSTTLPLQELAYIESEPLSKIIFLINKESYNLGAELLVEELEYKKINNSITPGILLDGSGLSRHNLVAPYDIVMLLKSLEEKPYKHIFYNSLPIAGVDGTLFSRFKETSAYNTMRAKTGSMSGIHSLSGYAQTTSHRNIIFSIVVNNALGECRDVIDEIALFLLKNY